jgi:hypothetical protein
VNALIWRLHHRQVYFALAALGALAAVLVVTGVVMSHDYGRFLSNCRVVGDCSSAPDLLFRGDGSIIDLVDATIIVPLLFGLFWGAPLVAKEFEDGTQSLAWTQGVTRRHWLTSNLAWVFGAAALWAGTIAVIVSWWRTPENAIGSRFTTFDIQGVVPIAYALFAVALGIAVGSVLRRVLPAIAVTLGAYVAVRALIGVYLRPHYLAPIKKVFTLSASGGAPNGSWLLSSGLVGPDGRFYSGGIDVNSMPAACRDLLAGGGKEGVQACMAAHGFHQEVTYQLASRFWTFQAIEAGIFVVLAGALVALAYRMVLHRDA